MKGLTTPRLAYAGFALLMTLGAGLTPRAQAAPVTTAWAGPGTSPGGVAASALSGFYAVSDRVTDSVEVRDVNQQVLATISRAQIVSAFPWMTLDNAIDGPTSMALSDSGRLLFVAVADESTAPDGQPDDGILRYDTQTGELTRFVRVNWYAGFAQPGEVTLAHFKGKLYFATPGGLGMYSAGTNDLTGTQQAFAPAGSANDVTGMTVDRLTSTLYYTAYNGSSTTLYTFPAGGVSATVRATFASQRYGAIAWHDHFGILGPGLLMLHTPTTTGGSRITYLTAAMARGTTAVSPTEYLADPAPAVDLAATADGGLLRAMSGSVQRVSESADPRLTFDGWKADEFAQVVTYARGLISPDGQPPGWVIDADTDVFTPRFHPASPDAACWTILMLLMNDRLNGDPGGTGQAQVRQILARYSGRLGAPAPLRNGDGIFIHWIDTATGGITWSSEYATMSTMKIVLAAQRAAAYYPDDASIQVSARAIIRGVKNWDAYFNGTNGGIYLVANPGTGPTMSSTSRAYNEAIIFAEQAAAYGGAISDLFYANVWLNWNFAPKATLVTGRPIAGDSAGNFQSAFLSLYPLLTMQDYRSSASWQTQVLNSRLSHMAWTDLNGPRWNTVFSAGTTKGIWGGYSADSLTNHPGDVATFTSLLAYSAGTGAGGGYTPPAVGAYQAYRVGARQTWRTGASMLYRRSNVDPSYAPNSAGLPDVALGALGLAEIIQPGSVQAVLTGAYQPLACNDADITGIGGVPVGPDQQLTVDDLISFVNAYSAGEDWADITGIGGPPAGPDGQLTVDDVIQFVNAFSEGC